MVGTLMNCTRKQRSDRWPFSMTEFQSSMEILKVIIYVESEVDTRPKAEGRRRQARNTKN